MKKHIFPSSYLFEFVYPAINFEIFLAYRLVISVAMAAYFMT